MTFFFLTFVGISDAGGDLLLDSLVHLVVELLLSHEHGEAGKEAEDGQRRLERPEALFFGPRHNLATVNEKRSKSNLFVPEKNGKRRNFSKLRGKKERKSFSYLCTVVQNGFLSINMKIRSSLRQP